MEEIGFVKSIDGINAKVIVARRNSCCENCTKDSCSVPEDGIETEAINAAGAKVGQKVKIALKTYTYYKGAVLLYIVPVLALVVGAIIGNTLLPRFLHTIDPELLAALSGFLFLFLSLIPVKIIIKRMDRGTEYKSVIESIVEG